jgi:hypothetical protein
MDLRAGDRLLLSLLSTEERFRPDLIVMGPGWDSQSNGSIGVDVPDGYGWVIVEGEATRAEFEPFTPGSYYHVAEYDQEVVDTGIYYVAVRTGHGSGSFSLAVGYLESFTITEWLSLPYSLIGVYRWEGQGWGTILGPALVVIIAWLGVILWFRRRTIARLSVFQWTSSISGVLILSWAAIVLTQMVMALGRSGWAAAAMLTIGFAGASIVMALYALTPAFTGPDVPDVGRRIGMVLVGALSFFIYTGLVLGPILALVVALLPSSVAGFIPGEGMRRVGEVVTQVP